MNRLTLVNAPGTDDDISYTYDTCTLGMGKLCSVTRDNVTVSYTYDVYGNIASIEQAIGAMDVNMTYAYNNDTHLESITYPSGIQILYSYDSAGRIASLTLDDGSTTIPLISAIAYQPFGPVNAYSQANGIDVTFNYDLDGRIQTLTANTALNREYEYDPAGNISLIDDIVTAALSRNYSYDAINRLVLEETTGTPQTLFDYGYDPVGNRTLYDDTVQTQSLTYGSTNNRLTAIDAQSVTTDANGNIISIHGMTLAYDSHNRMSSATIGSDTTNYTYNGLGERVTKQNAQTTHYLYSGPQLLAEYASNGAIQREYIYLEDQPVVMLRHTGASIETYWIQNDHLGRPLALTDDSGDVVWRWLNADAFGNAGLIDEDPDNNSIHLTFNLRFPGQIYDAETSLWYNYERYLDPKTGRYVTSDRIGLEGGLNTYVYVENNPTNYIDPEGLQAVLPSPVPLPIPVPRNPIMPDAQPSSGSGSSGIGSSFGERSIGRPNGRGRFECIIKCDGVQITGSGQGKGVDCESGDCPKWIYGWGKGSTAGEAWNNAWDAANSNTPKGCQKRHCKGVAGSCKNWKGGKR